MDSKSRTVLILGAVAAIVGLLAASSFFVLNETQQALVIQFGRIEREAREPGLYWKLPLIQNVVRYDKRVLDVDPSSERVILADQKRLVVDAFARYRIVDVTRFYKTVGTEAAVEARLGSVLSASLRRVLGGVALQSLLSNERAAVMQRIKTQVDDEAQAFGIRIVDVRIRRADLPEETSQSIYARMKSEREREAAEFRAQGVEQAQQIKAKADRDRTVLLAEAERDAQVLRGQGDAEAIRIYADAFGRDPEFYGFYRSMQAYRKSLGSEDSTLVLSPQSEFLRYLQRSLSPGR
jgi:modulator of FtsH protease HflC